MAQDNTGKSEHPLVGKGLIFKSDIRNNAFPMYAMQPKLSDDMRQSWAIGPVLNQGQSSQCVAYAWTQALQTSPWAESNLLTPADLYADAQATDGMEGAEPTHYGTTVKAAADILLKKGFIPTYVWGTTVEDVAKYIFENGPVVAGTNWYTGMSSPGSDGFARPTSTFEGGHAWLIYGVDVQWETFFAVNSWGTTYGKNGRFFVKFSDFDKLLQQGAQVCAASKSQ